MKNYFLFRTDSSVVNDEIDVSTDYFGGDITQIQENDVCICYQPNTLLILGIFVYTSSQTLQLIQKNTTHCTIRDCYDCFSFIQEITQNTSRMFKKKSRKILENDFLQVQKKL